MTNLTTEQWMNALAALGIGIAILAVGILYLAAGIETSHRKTEARIGRASEAAKRVRGEDGR